MGRGSISRNGGPFYHDLLRDPIKLKNRGAGQSFEKCMSNDKPSGWGRGQTGHIGKVSALPFLISSSRYFL